MSDGKTSVTQPKEGKKVALHPLLSSCSSILWHSKIPFLRKKNKNQKQKMEGQTF